MMNGCRVVPVVTGVVEPDVRRCTDVTRESTPRSGRRSRSAVAEPSIAAVAAAALDDMARGLGHPAFLDAKTITARFYADQFLPQVRGLLRPVTGGHRATMAMAEAAF